LSPSSAARTTSKAGSFGLLRCSMRASVQGRSGFSGRTTMPGIGSATATSGTIDMPRPDATACFAASTMPTCMGCRVRGNSFAIQCMTRAWTAAAIVLEHEGLLRDIVRRDLVGDVPRRRRQDRHA